MAQKRAGAAGGGRSESHSFQRSSLPDGLDFPPLASMHPVGSAPSGTAASLLSNGTGRAPLLTPFNTQGQSKRPHVNQATSARQPHPDRAASSSSVNSQVGLASPNTSAAVPAGFCFGSLLLADDSSPGSTPPELTATSPHNSTTNVTTNAHKASELQRLQPEPGSKHLLTSMAAPAGAADATGHALAAAIAALQSLTVAATAHAPPTSGPAAPHALDLTLQGVPGAQSTPSSTGLMPPPHAQQPPPGFGYPPGFSPTPLSPSYTTIGQTYSAPPPAPLSTPPTAHYAPPLGCTPPPGFSGTAHSANSATSSSVSPGGGAHRGSSGYTHIHSRPLGLPPGFPVTPGASPPSGLSHPQQSAPPAGSHTQTPLVAQASSSSGAPAGQRAPPPGFTTPKYAPL